MINLLAQKTILEKHPLASYGAGDLCCFYLLNNDLLSTNDVDTLGKL